MQRRTFVNSFLGGLKAGLSGGEAANTETPDRRVPLQESPLAGYDYHRASDVWPFLRVGDSVRLVRERHNVHDANAIAVYYMNDRLGYVPRGENNALAGLMDRGEPLDARIVRLLDTDNPWRRVRIRVDLLVV